MQENQKLQEHPDKFNKLCLDLENIGVNYEDEDRALVLLYSLPKSYENFVDILQHGRDKLSLEDVIRALNSKELSIKMDVKFTPSDALTVRSRNAKNDSKGNKGKSRLKSRNGKGLLNVITAGRMGISKDFALKERKIWLKRNHPMVEQI